MQHLNTRDASVVPELADLMEQANCNARGNLFSLAVLNSGAKEITKDILESAQYGKNVPCGIVGPVSQVFISVLWFRKCGSSGVAYPTSLRNRPNT